MIKVTCGYPKGVPRTKTTELSSKDPINDPSDNPTHVPPTDIYRAPIDAPISGSTHIPSKVPIRDTRFRPSSDPYYIM